MTEVEGSVAAGFERVREALISGLGVSEREVHRVASRSRSSELIDAATWRSRLASVGLDLQNRLGRAVVDAVTTTDDLIDLMTRDIGSMLGDGSFGHPGAGGRRGFADSERGVAGGYARNQLLWDGISVELRWSWCAALSDADR